MPTYTDIFNLYIVIMSVCIHFNVIYSIHCNIYLRFYYAIKHFLKCDFNGCIKAYEKSGISSFVLIPSIGLVCCYQYFPLNTIIKETKNTSICILKVSDLWKICMHISFVCVYIDVLTFIQVIYTYMCIKFKR